jgi:hypothetical protein
MFTTKIQATLPQFQRHSLRYTGYSGTHYSKKLSRLALLLANALSTSSGVGQCTRWHCSNKGASSRSSVMVERIDVSVRCNFENTRSDSHVVTGIEVYKPTCYVRRRRRAAALTSAAAASEFFRRRRRGV